VIRFYLDEDLSQKIAAIARERGIDAISSHECGQNGDTDEEQLRFVARERRCFETQDFRDLVRITMELQLDNRPHAGVVFVPVSLPHWHFATVADAIIQFAAEHREGLPPYAIMWLSSQRRGGR
jgi:hypothetical protein